MSNSTRDERYAEIVRRLEELELAKPPPTPPICTEEAGNILPPTPKVRPPSFANLLKILDLVENLEVLDKVKSSTTSGSSTPVTSDSGYGTGEEDVFEQAFTNASPPVIKQIFFDCDNTLVKTEDLTVQAAADVLNKCLSDHGVDYYRFTTEEVIHRFFGMTARQMLKPAARGLGFELKPSEFAKYGRYEEDLVIDLIRTKSEPCPGVKSVLDELHKSGQYKLAVVSSSPIRRIRAALEAAGIARYFDHDQIFSAKSTMPTPISKPDPAIYEWAMKKNNVYPWECIADEDSRSGARSAISAEIACIGYVGAYMTQDHKDQVANTLKSEGCQEVVYNYSQFQGMFNAAADHVVAARLEKQKLGEPDMLERDAMDFNLWLVDRLEKDKYARRVLNRLMQHDGWREALPSVLDEILLTTM